jgi:hypothetical protein
MSAFDRLAKPPTIPGSINVNTAQVNLAVNVPYPKSSHAATNKKYVDEKTVNGYTSSVFQENPSAGNTSQSFQVALPSETLGKLTSLRIRWEYPFAAGESSSIRLYRYRKVNGVFTYTQITDIITLNDTLDWSTWHNFANTIRDYDLDTNTDTIVATNIHTDGPSPSVRALLTVFGVGPVEENDEMLNDPGSLTETWPPT